MVYMRTGYIDGKCYHIYTIHGSYGYIYIYHLICIIYIYIIHIVMNNLIN